jgi:DNA-binding transcriptional LysR family regulator/transcription elongation GreA/GreB family factor
MVFFARVVEARSFSDAARSLGFSKSAVSARVSRLEERLGVRLLHRTTRRLALTADGVRLYEHCARVLAEADEAAGLAAGASAVPRGVLRAHASPALASLLTGPIGSFMSVYPEVRVDLRVGDRLPDLAADAVDVAVVVAHRLVDSGLLAKKLATARVVTCAAPSYLRQRGIPFRPQDLVHHQCLAHSLAQFEDWHLDTEEGPVSTIAGARMVVDDSRCLQQAALDGLGIAMLPDFLIADDLASGRLHAVLDDFQSIELSISALHSHAQHPPARLRVFVDHLAASFRPPRLEGASTGAPAPRRAARRRDRAAIPMTEQDVRRLTAVAALYAAVDEDGTARLRQALARAKVTRAAKIPRGAVTMNSRVLCRDEEGDERELSLAYPWDASTTRASVLDPGGSALLGATIGSAFVHGGRRLTVAAIPYQPEAAGDHHF